MATLLDIVEDVAIQIGLPVPESVVSNTNAAVRQLLRLVQQSGNELMREFSWTALRKLRTFGGIAQNAQTGEPPSDFDRFVPNTSLWNSGDRRKLVGVTNSERWMRLLVEEVEPAVEYWTMYQGVINITPEPTTDYSYLYSYVSKNWIRPTGATSNDTDKAAFTADTDEPLLSAELLTMDTVWRWKQAKGLDYAEDMITAQRFKEKLMGDDRGPHEVPLAVEMPIADNVWPWEIG